MKKLTGYFLKGLLIFVPAALTVAAVLLVLNKLDNALSNLFPFEFPPGVSLLIASVVTLVGITTIGLIAQNIIGRKIFAFIDKLFTQVPFIKLLYTSLKDFIAAFAGDKKSFDKPVLVELVPNGPKAAGFITRHSVDMLGIADHVAVYLPQSYNFAGSVLIIPADKVTPIEIDSSEAMAFIVSGGVTGAN